MLHNDFNVEIFINDRCAFIDAENST